MHSCVKSDFIYKLEELVPCDKIRNSGLYDAVILYGHAVIRRFAPPSNQSKMVFREMAAGFVGYVMHTVKEINLADTLEIHDICDRYCDTSVKRQTRIKPGHCDEGLVYHVQPEITIIPNWRHFLTNGKNKAKRTSFYTGHRRTRAGSVLCDWQLLYVSGENGIKQCG